MTTPTTPREESLGSYEMLWDCPHCDTKKNLGVTHRHCPNCGAPQDATKRYFPSDAERVAVADHAFTGADRVCGSCGAAQSAKAHNCGRCGAPLDGTKAVPFVVEKQPLKPRGKSWGWYILAAIVLLSVAIWWRCIRKKSIELDVAGHRWATTIAVEEFREVEETKWRNEVPSGARAVSCTSKERSTKSVPDGETCTKVKRDKGDGTFEEVNQCTPKTKKEPVYDDWCGYRIDRWTTVETLKRDGAGLEVAWPEPPVTTGVTGPGARRAGERKGVYTLEFSDGKKRRTCDVAEATWRKYKDGQHVKAKARASSGDLVCSSL
ncbi:MAG: hypothetical protein IPL61_38195 [Myxococcales bacterium]|nr:hypothetical protein [Myxococcales bacterium]